MGRGKGPGREDGFQSFSNTSRGLSHVGILSASADPKVGPLLTAGIGDQPKSEYAGNMS